MAKDRKCLCPEFDCELTGISIAASGRRAPDCWQLEIDDHRILETIYLKEIAEEFVFRCCNTRHRGIRS